jgi:hypothetical protein
MRGTEAGQADYNKIHLDSMFQKWETPPSQMIQDRKRHKKGVQNERIQLTLCICALKISNRLTLFRLIVLHMNVVCS